MFIETRGSGIVNNNNVDIYTNVGNYPAGMKENDKHISDIIRPHEKAIRYIDRGSLDCDVLSSFKNELQ